MLQWRLQIIASSTFSDAGEVRLVRKGQILIVRWHLSNAGLNPLSSGDTCGQKVDWTASVCEYALSWHVYLNLILLLSWNCLPPHVSRVFQPQNVTGDTSHFYIIWNCHFLRVVLWCTLTHRLLWLFILVAGCCTAEAPQAQSHDSQVGLQSLSALCHAVH